MWYVICIIGEFTQQGVRCGGTANSACVTNVAVFMTIDCNIPAARGFQVVTDERTPLSRLSAKNVKVLKCHVGHTTTFHRLLPSTFLLRKLIITMCAVEELKGIC